MPDKAVSEAIPGEQADSGRDQRCSRQVTSNVAFHIELFTFLNDFCFEFGGGLMEMVALLDSAREEAFNG